MRASTLSRSARVCSFASALAAKRLRRTGPGACGAEVSTVRESTWTSRRRILLVYDERVTPYREKYHQVKCCVFAYTLIDSGGCGAHWKVGCSATTHNPGPSRTRPRRAGSTGSSPLAPPNGSSTAPWSRGRSRASWQRTLPCGHDARVRGRCRGCTGCPRSALSRTRIAAHRTARRASRHRGSHVASCSFECLD